MDCTNKIAPKFSHPTILQKKAASVGPLPYFER
jgi:hypothetical protein